MRVSYCKLSAFWGAHCVFLIKVSSVMWQLTSKDCGLFLRAPCKCLFSSLGMREVCMLTVACVKCLLQKCTSGKVCMVIMMVLHNKDRWPRATC